MMNRRKFIRRIVTGGGIAALTASYPIFIERNIVCVNHYKIPLKNLPPAFDGYKIAQLTDLHLGFLVSPSFIENIIHRTNKLNPNMIVCTGDYVHERNTKNEIEKVWPLLCKLHAEDGVYSVLGNHDHWADLDRSIYWMERSGHDLRHKAKIVDRGTERLIIGGAGDFWEDDLNIDETFSSTDEGDCRILLSHNPDSIDTNFKTPLDLTLCGHTHGGQVKIPFYGAPILPVKNLNYSQGLINTPQTQLFISRGIGWAIYPVRFNCYPEIAVLELCKI